MAISKNNVTALQNAGCDPSVSTFTGNEVIELSKKNLATMPNRQILLFVADVEACVGKTGAAANIDFPKGFIMPDQYSKLKYDLKAELDKFDVGNSKEGIDYITGYTSQLSFESSFMNIGAYADFIEKKIIDMPENNKALVATLMLYGVSNPTIDKDWNISGDGLKAILKVGPLEAGELIATGDEKKISNTKITQHSTLSTKKITLPNTNGQFNNLMTAMFGIDDIQDGIWDNNNPIKLLK